MGGIYALVAMGLALVFGVMNVINFAHGDFVMLAMYITYFLSLMLTLDPILVPLITIPMFFVLGIGVYMGTLHKIVRGPALSQIAVTVGLMVLLRNVTLALWRAEPKAIQYTAVAGYFHVGPFIFPTSRLFGAVVSILTLVALHLFLTRTKLGLAIRATAEDADAASLFGVNVRNVYAFTFGLGTGLIALAGALIMTFQEVNPLSGLLYGLLSWVIVAMGGLGGVVGVFFSSIILAIAESIGITFWDPRAREIIIYLIFIILLWVRPTGLFAKR